MRASLQIVKPPDCAANANLSPLLLDHQRLADEESRISAALAALARPIAAEGSIGGELAAIEALESNDIQAWAEAGGTGAAPALRIEERASLEARSREITAKARGARSASVGMNSQFANATRQRQAAQDAIEVAVIGVMDDWLLPVFGEIAEASAALATARAKAIAASQVAFEMASARNARNEDSGAPFAQWGERLSARIAATKGADAPSLEAVSTAAGDWQATLATASGGIVGGRAR